MEGIDENVVADNLFCVDMTGVAVLHGGAGREEIKSWEGMDE